MHPLILFTPCYTFIDCKDTYPQGYWNKCPVGCEWLKEKNNCAKKWKEVFTWRPNCKKAIENIKHHRVDRSCRKTCQICGSSICTTLTIKC